MNLNNYLGMLHQAEKTLAHSFRQVAQGHGAEPDIQTHNINAEASHPGSPPEWAPAQSRRQVVADLSGPPGSAGSAG